MKNICSLFAVILLFWNVSFAQNDNCALAPQLFPSLTTCNYISGSSNGATQSRPGCSGNSDDDVWYYFVANSTTMTIKVDPAAGYDAVFDLYSGSCAGSVVSGSCTNLKSAGLNEQKTFSTLTVGNTYYLRIYHSGVGSGTSAFRVCVYGVAPPTNTTPCGAFALPAVTPSCNYQTYQLINTGSSSVPTPSSCTGGSSATAGYAGGDMWFKVAVPASGKLEISTLGVSGLTDCGMAIYSGLSCSGGLTQIACNDDKSAANGKFMPYIYRTGLTPGDTIYIRFWDFNNNNNGLFKLCVSSPDNGTCPSALNICDINGYGGTTSSNYPVDRPSNMRGKDEAPPGGVFGLGYTGSSPVQLDNNSWITFQAASTTASFTVEIEDCQDNRGMQMQIFSGNNCTNFAPVSNFLETTNSQVINANGLIPGNSYYIVIDGFAGDVCSYTVTANSGVQTVSAGASDTSFCVGSSATVFANVFGSGSYTYTWYSIPAGGPYPSTSSFTVTPNVDTEYFVDITGACGGVTTASVKLFVKPTPTAPAVSATQTTICPTGTTTITGSGGPAGSQYYVYNAASGGSSVGVSPYTYSPSGFSGSRTFYIETQTVDSCISSSRTPITIVSQDNTAPTISCPANQVVYVNGACTFALPDYRLSSTISDNCMANVTNVTQSPIPGTTLSGHNTNQIVTITATDANGNASSCSFTVNLQDSAKPVLVGCPGDAVVNVDANCQYVIPDYTTSLTVTDNCNTPSTIVYTQTPAAGTILSGVGFTQTVTVIANDGANNMSTCTFDLTLEDATPATLSCPLSLRDTTDLDECKYFVPDFSGAITLTSDNCSNNGNGANITQTPAIGTEINILEADVDYVVTLTYTDASNNQSTCSFTVTAVCLRDLIIPEFISPNGDGLNDAFVIENIDVYPGNKIKIFNRWGNLVYQKENYDNTWDGKTSVNSPKFGSSYLPSGTYFYIITRPNQDDVSGFIRLERN